MRVRGTRDFPPEEEIARREILATIEETFREFGFVPLETPALELGETLLKKGESIRDEIYIFEDKGGRDIGLRFDLTVPLMRYIEETNVQLPFRRYAIGKVWRYDRPQAGRYREFTQADVDIIGSKSVFADVECVLAGVDALKKIKVPEFYIKVNSRELLQRICNEIGVKDFVSFVRILDKWDKIGEEGVREEMRAKGMENELDMFLKYAEKDVSELEDDNILKFIELVEGYVDVKFDLRLARGLDYYTGLVFETFVKNGPGSSIAGGGRYDGFAKGLPATGYSIGVDRVFSLLEEKGILKKRRTYSFVYIAPVSGYADQAFKIAMTLRSSGIPCEFDVMERKLSKQMEYAGKKGIPYVIIVGDEWKEGKVLLRDMDTGEQRVLNLNDAVAFLKEALS